MSSSKFGKILGPRVVSRVANHFMHRRRILGSYLSLGTHFVSNKLNLGKTRPISTEAIFLSTKRCSQKAGKQNVLSRNACINADMPIYEKHTSLHFMLTFCFQSSETMRIVYPTSYSICLTLTSITRDSPRGPNWPQHTHTHLLNLIHHHS